MVSYPQYGQGKHWQSDLFPFMQIKPFKDSFTANACLADFMRDKSVFFYKSTSHNKLSAEGGLKFTRRFLAGAKPYCDSPKESYGQSSFGGQIRPHQIYPDFVKTRLDAATSLLPGKFTPSP